jgi:hypothetical protein
MLLQQKAQQMAADALGFRLTVSRGDASPVSRPGKRKTEDPPNCPLIVYDVTINANFSFNLRDAMHTWCCRHSYLVGGDH